MKLSPRKITLMSSIPLVIVLIAAGVVGVLQLQSAMSGGAWNPWLAGACGVMILAGLYVLIAARQEAAFVCFSRSFRGMGRGAFHLALWTAWWAAIGVSTSALLDWSRGTSNPAGPEALRGAFLGLGTLLMMTAFKRGWIQGVFVAPNKLKEQQQELARQRDDILAQARQK